MLGIFSCLCCHLLTFFKIVFLKTSFRNTIRSQTGWIQICTKTENHYQLFKCWVIVHAFVVPGCIAQSVTCLTTDGCLTAFPGVASLISAQSHTFVEIDHEIIFTVILLPSADSFKKGCCQLQGKVCAQITG